MNEWERAVKEYGTASAAAKALGMPRATFVRRLRGIKPKPPAKGTKTPRPAPVAKTPTETPMLTREMLKQARLPTNQCPVKAFLDTMSSDQQALAREAIGYRRQDLSHAGLRQLFIDAHYPEETVPSANSFANHRNRKAPSCRCNQG